MVEYRIEKDVKHYAEGEGMSGEKKKKKRLWKSLQGRLIIYNLSIVVLVSLIGSIGTYHSAFKRSREMTKQSMGKRIDGISEKFSVACEEMMNIILNCTGRNSMSMGSLDFTQQPSGRKQALINSSLMSDYCAISGYGSYITKLMISDKNGHFIQAGNSLGSVDDFARLQETEWFEREAQKDAGTYKLDLVDSPFFKEKGTKIIPLVRALDTTGRMREEGWGFLGISTRLFEEELQVEDNGNAMIAAVHDGTVIAGINREMFGEEELERVTRMLLEREESGGVLECSVQREKCLVAYAKNGISGILTYEIMPLSRIRNERNLLRYLAVFLFLSCIIIGVTLSVVFSNRIRKPVDLLTNQVKKIGNGDFSYNPQIEREDELGEIGEGINRMSGRISQLLEKSVEDEAFCGIVYTLYQTVFK